MKPELSRQKQIAGLLYGLAGGLSFAVFAWGIDGLLLARAHGAFPWVKFIPGLVICLISGGLVGWLTIKLNQIFLGIIAWVAMALLYSQMIIWLPIRVAPALIKLSNVSLGEYLKYPYYPELNQHLWFGFAIIAIVAIINGLLERILVEQALFTSGKYAIIVPMVVCALSFGLAGNTGDSLMNKNFREPIQIVDELIQFAQDNVGKEVPGDVARAMHLGALNTVKEYVVRDRKLILSNFDQYMGQVDVLVDFEGKWVKCTTIFNQVTNCKPALEMPWIRLSGIHKLAEVISTKKLVFN
jgi:hypothetical protein